MSWRNSTILAVVVTVAGCEYDDDCCDSGLTYYEEAYLTEDVLDLMSNVFATAEHAFDGDFPAPGDVTQIAEPGNQYTAVYLLNEAFRPGFGQGNGDVALQVTADGVPVTDPLLFSFVTTTALDVELVYDIVYFGVTAGARESDIQFTATVDATRASLSDPWLVEYRILGTAFFGTTFCDFSTFFRCPGPPSAGVEDYGDGAGYIDDPDVYDVFDLNINYGVTQFGAEGPVGCCAYYSAGFFYDQISF